jgi:hypothetical protein
LRCTSDASFVIAAHQIIPSLHRETIDILNDKSAPIIIRTTEKQVKSDMTHFVNPIFSMFGSHMSAAVRLLRTKASHRRQLPLHSSQSNQTQHRRRRRHLRHFHCHNPRGPQRDPPALLPALPHGADQKWGAAGLIAMDTIGIARGWRVMDHYGHLSGAAFSVACFFGGPYLWAKIRQTTAPSSSEQPLPKP